MRSIVTTKYTTIIHYTVSAYKSIMTIWQSDVTHGIQCHAWLHIVTCALFPHKHPRNPDNTTRASSVSWAHRMCTKQYVAASHFSHKWPPRWRHTDVSQHAAVGCTKAGYCGPVADQSPESAGFHAKWVGMLTFGTILIAPSPNPSLSSLCNRDWLHWSKPQLMLLFQHCWLTNKSWKIITWDCSYVSTQSKHISGICLQINQYAVPSQSCFYQMLIGSF